MFAPEGYYVWNEINEVTDQWAENIVISHHLQKEGLASAEPFENEEALYAAWLNNIRDKPKEAIKQRVEQSLLSAYLTANFIRTFPTYICSQDGVVLRAPDIFLLHADRLDLCYWDWQRDESPYFKLFFQNAVQSNLQSDSIWERFCAIDAFSGTITIKNNTLSTAVSASHWWDVTERDFERIITPFIGWALCWKFDDIPKKIEDVFIAIGDEFTEFGRMWDKVNSGSVFKARSKAASLENVYQCTMRAFPAGKGHASWKEVENSVGYSRRHILRAIAYKKAEWWAQEEGTPKA